MLSLILLLAAAEPAAPARPPARIATLVVYGSDPCPRGATPDEIVVCARQPESERYRVPKRFRGSKTLPAQQSWTNTVTELDRVGRVGTPDSCSPVGSGGQTGCFTQFLRQAREERRQMERDADDVP